MQPVGVIVEASGLQESWMRSRASSGPARTGPWHPTVNVSQGGLPRLFFAPHDTRKSALSRLPCRILARWRFSRAVCCSMQVKFQQRYVKSHRKVPPTPSHLPCDLSWLPA